ncbi:MAG: molecular chaperone HtpG [Eubacteriales bacterium]
MDNENMDNKNIRSGGISVEIEHIFPIIKKWLYSEKEIFLREIVSNACDAVTKLRRLVSLGEAKDIDLSGSRIRVILNKEQKTITVTDNGIGMTEEELQKYICQIALSGALDFVQKYENADTASESGIIGHFGLGFYSSFMVSDTVDVITRSYASEKTIRWSCSDAGEYTIDADYTDIDHLIDTRGTAVIMHISEEGEEFLSAPRLKDVLNKYCAFMPVEIYFEDESADAPKPEENPDGKDEEEKKPQPMNDTNPLWLRQPSEITDEQYKDFYHKVFGDYRDPLFYIHLRADYPLNFKGILYFPRITNEYESLEGQVKLYYNQVFVADNIKEVIPEYLLMLKGVLDCPEMPLNVSRSYLQNSGYVAKISAHITKKVADKINSLFTGERENYEKLWRDLKTFVEYGCMRDRKFYDKVKGSILFEKCSGGFLTLSEYLEAAKEKHENKVYYATDKTAQSQYISMFESEGIDVVLLDRMLETQFISMLESTESGVKFARVDAEVADAMHTSDENGAEIKGAAELFAKIAGEHTKIESQALKDEAVPAVLTVSEESRRMDDMMRMYASPEDRQNSFPLDAKLILNTSNALIQKIDALSSEDEAKAEKLARQVYALSLLSQRKLSAEELKNFLAGSYELLGML